MKIVLVIAAVLLSACSYLQYELDYANQRSEAKSYENYLPWAAAESEVVSRCDEVRSIYQGHSRVVDVSFEGSDAITTISPEIDQIFGVIHNCRGGYEGISVIME